MTQEHLQQHGTGPRAALMHVYLCTDRHREELRPCRNLGAISCGFRKLPENGVGRDAPAELTEIAEEGKLDDVLHVFQLWDQGQRAGRSPDLAPIRNWGPHNRIKEAPHHGKGFVTHQSLVLGRQAGCRPFAILQQPGQSLCHAARLMKDNAQVLEGCRPRDDMLPNMPRVRAAAIEDNNFCLRRTDGERQAQAEGMHAVQKVLKPSSCPGQQDNIVGVHES